MKKAIWLVLLVVVAVAVVGINGFWQQPEAQPIIETRKVEIPQPQPSPQLPVITAPQVSADRLFTHIQKLNFQRYTDAQRSRTRRYITRELKKFGWKPQLQKFSQGVNIFASRQGTEKDAGAILLGAHYDTVANSPGADDNASGIAVVLEIARLLGSRPTPRTLQLAFFDKEEAGLLGSRAFTAKTEQLQNLDGVVVLDMLGYACYTSGCQQYPEGLPITPPSDKGDFLAVIGDTEHLALLSVFQNSHDIAATPDGKPECISNPNNLSLASDASATKCISKAKTNNLPPVFTLPVPFKGLLIPDTMRSDHAPFWLQGIGAVLVTDTANLRSQHYHQPSDTPINIKRSFFTGAAQVVVNAITEFLENGVNPR
ncbi:MAG: M28 family peptidase [Nostocaceae cyanobacterium]|nr:M28 family peptidase [Nostocaceae cyanobacterium]